MSAAARICAYLATHGTATRPELQRELDLHEKAVESAIRKLQRLGMVKMTDGKRREGGPRYASLYRLGAVPFNQDEFSRWATTGVRSTRSRVDCSDAFAALGRALFAATA